jgi:hypothetical protein
MESSFKEIGVPSQKFRRREIVSGLWNFALGFGAGWYLI